jgi:hypothetical protein
MIHSHQHTHSFHKKSQIIVRSVALSLSPLPLGCVVCFLLTVHHFPQQHHLWHVVSCIHQRRVPPKWIFDFEFLRRLPLWIRNNQSFCERFLGGHSWEVPRFVQWRDEVYCDERQHRMRAAQTPTTRKGAKLGQYWQSIGGSEEGGGGARLVRGCVAQIPFGIRRSEQNKQQRHERGLKGSFHSHDTQFGWWIVHAPTTYLHGVEDSNL